MAMSQKMGYLEILPIEEANVSGLARDRQYHSSIMFMVISSISSNVSLRMSQVLYYIIQAWIVRQNISQKSYRHC